MTARNTSRSESQVAAVNTVSEYNEQSAQDKEVKDTRLLIHKNWKQGSKDPFKEYLISIHFFRVFTMSPPTYRWFPCSFTPNIFTACLLCTTATWSTAHTYSLQFPESLPTGPRPAHCFQCWSYIQGTLDESLMWHLPPPSPLNFFVSKNKLTYWGLPKKVSLKLPTIFLWNGWFLILR